MLKISRARAALALGIVALAAVACAPQAPGNGGDTLKPVLSLPSAVTAEATGPAGATVTYTATAHDAKDGTVPVTCSKASGTTFDLGSTTVTCSATDAAGNTATGSFAVTVVDTTDPVLALPVAVEETSTDPDGTFVSWDATATDAVDGDLAVDCTPAPGTEFTLGDTTVTCTATDFSGNSASGSFTVSVILGDTVEPTLTLPVDIYVEATGPDGAEVDWTATATDDIDGDLDVECSPTPGVFAVGNTTVMCSAIDSAGNTAYGEFMVTVEDTTAPVLDLPDGITVETSDQDGAIVTFTATATDIVDGTVAVECVPASGSLFEAGDTTVTCGAYDVTGNEALGDFTVTVIEV